MSIEGENKQPNEYKESTGEPDRIIDLENRVAELEKRVKRLERIVDEIYFLMRTLVL